MPKLPSSAAPSRREVMVFMWFVDDQHAKVHNKPHWTGAVGNTPAFNVPSTSPNVPFMAFWTQI